jgi:hypothetical protein
MKKFLILALAIGFITTCNNKKEENDEDAILALALSQLNQLPSTCNVTVSFLEAKYNNPMFQLHIPLLQRLKRFLKQLY